MYVTDKRGARVICPHPNECHKVSEVIAKLGSPFTAEMQLYDSHLFYGFNLLLRRIKSLFSTSQKPFDIRATIRERTGFNSDCICTTCCASFSLDIRRDPRRCPECKNVTVKTVRELVGASCPKCKQGKVQKLNTGIIS